MVINAAESYRARYCNQCASRNMKIWRLSWTCLIVIIGGLSSLSSANDEVIKDVLLGAVFSYDMERSAAHNGFKFASNNLYTNNETLRKRYKTAAAIEFVHDISDNFQISSAICRLVSRGVLAIFGPIHYKTVNMVMSLTDHFEVVYFTHSDVFDFDSLDSLDAAAGRGIFVDIPQGKYIVHLRPVLTNAIIDFISHEDWNHIFYLYDTKEALLRLRGIFEKFNQNKRTLSADPRNVDDNAVEILNLINLYSKEAKKRVVLDISKNSNRDAIFQEVHIIRQKRFDYHYLIIGADINEINLREFNYGGVNITGLSLIDASNPWIKNFTRTEWFREVEIKSPSSTASNTQVKTKKFIPVDAALMIDGVNVFAKALAMTKRSPLYGTLRHSNEACVPSLNPEFTAVNLTNSIKKIDMKGLTGILRFDEKGFRKDFNVSVVQIGLKSNRKEIGYWTAATKLHLYPDDEETNRRSIGIIKNRTRIVTSILSPPFLMELAYTIDGRPLVGNDRYEGFCANLTEIIARRLNFKYIILPVKDGAYGSEINETWNGMIGELVNEEAHLAVAPLTIMSNREKVVDFTKPFMEVGLSVMYVKAKIEEKDVFSFMKPLSTEIWMCIAFAYLGVSVVLFLVSRFSPYEWHFNEEKQENITNDFSIFNSFWFSLSAFMQQGSDISPRSLSGRIVGSVWWFFTLIIVSSYTANLAAFLTVERMSSSIKGYEDLAKQSKIKYGVVRTGSSEEFFKTSEIPTFKRMWHVMRTNPNYLVSSIEEGYEKVKNSNRDYAFLLESTMNEYYQGLKPCTTSKVGPNLDSGKGYGIATPSGSDLREAVNLEVLELKEMNKIHEFFVHWWKKRSQCQEEEKEKTGATSALGLSKVWGLFYILFGGLIVGILLSIMEFIYRCIVETKRRKCLFKEVFFEMRTLVIRGKLRKSTWASNGVSTNLLNPNET